MSQSHEQRSESYFFNMRKFHNKIKRTLYSQYSTNSQHILEIGVGKSGDLRKWIDNNIKNVKGYDIDQTSIIEGQRRVKELNSTITNINLYVKDLSKEIVEGTKNCDVVSAQFCFHYFFQSKQTFDIIMETINNNIKIGGYFMGTLFDGKTIKKLLTHDSFKLIDQGLRFEITPLNQLTDDLFGNKINVFLKDTVLDKPMTEYVVDFTQFTEIMKIHGFELIETHMFNKLYHKQQAYKRNLNDIEKKVSFLNRTFVFKKIHISP